MKSKFAKFVDYSLGACLIFIAAVAVMRYYAPLDLAVFSALSVTACACLLLTLKTKKTENRQKLSDAAEDMFYALMFSDERAHARLLCKGLRSVGAQPVIHGKGVYINNTAAFCKFTRTDADDVARMISKAAHYGAKKLVIVCKTPPSSTVNTADMKVTTVYGENAYKLFASLDALPETRFKKPQKRRFAALKHALDKDRIMHYALLSAAMFAITVFLSRSIVTFACACVCALLCAAAVAYNIVKAISKPKSTAQER